MKQNISYNTHTSFLEKVQQGNEKAWFEFYRKYVGMIRHVGTQRGLSPSECDDLMNEVMFIFWKKMSLFTYDRTKGRFRSYLGQIADFVTMKILRKKHRDGNIPEPIDLTYPEDIDATPLEEWKDFLIKQALEDLKNSIDTETYQVFYMSFFQNRPVAEISAVTRKTANNIYVIRSRCIRKLKALIAQYRQMDEAELLRHSNKKQLEI